MPTISCVCIITFTFYSSSFFLQTTFTLTQVVLRAIIFTFTQVPKKVTRLNTANAVLPSQSWGVIDLPLPEEELALPVAE